MITDVGTNEGLRGALALLPTRGGWNGPMGRHIITEVRRRARAIASRFAPTSHVLQEDLIDDLVAYGWEMLSVRSDSVLRAGSPWGVVTTALLRRARDEARAAELMNGSRAARREVEVHASKAARRYGDWTQLEAQVHEVAGAGDHSETVLDGWDAGLKALHAELVAAGAPSKAAADAIDGALALLERGVRRSWVHHAAYRDGRLRAQMNRTQVRALMDLLIGSRRHGAAGSAWLALRQAAQEGRTPRISDAHPQSTQKVRALIEPWLGDDRWSGQPQQMELALGPIG